MKDKFEKKTKQPLSINYENKRLSILYFAPLLIIAGFVPLITYAKYLDLQGTTQSLFWTGQQQYLDFFSYWKSRWLIVLTAITCVFYIVLYKQNKLPFKNVKQYYIPLGIYAIFVLISTLFAVDTTTALWGFVDMYQGMFVLMSYVFITFLTINFINNESDLSLFVRAFLFLMLVEGFIGIGQYFGFDIYQTDIGKSLIMPGNLLVENLSFSFGPKTIYGTLFNTNYVGSFATLMLPMSIAALLGAKSMKQRICAVLASVLMIFIWIGCNSRAGYIGVAISSILGLWLFRKAIKRYWKISVSLLAASAVIFVGFNFISDGELLSRIKTFNLIEQIENMKVYNENALKFESIELGKNTFSVKTNKETLNFKVEQEKLYFLDKEFNELEIVTKGNEITFKDPNYSRYKIFMPEDYPGVTVTIGGSLYKINFYIGENNIKILGTGGRITTPVVAERIESWDDYDGLLSDRVYIWSRTIPLLKDNFIKGVGADNFPIAFPQDDFVGKLNTGWDANMVVDKPHNMYLQIGLNTGVISLLSLLAAWSIYLITSLKIYNKIHYDSLEKYVGVACFISIFGYLVAGFFNDQVVSVAPLFWIILGMGICINFNLNKKGEIN